jgi:hypothetical protein
MFLRTYFTLPKNEHSEALESEGFTAQEKRLFEILDVTIWNFN